MRNIELGKPEVSDQMDYHQVLRKQSLHYFEDSMKSPLLLQGGWMMSAYLSIATSSPNIESMGRCSIY